MSHSQKGKNLQDCASSKSDDESTNGKAKSSGGAIPKVYSSQKPEQSENGSSKSKSPLRAIGKIFSSSKSVEKADKKEGKSPSKILDSAASFFGIGRSPKSPSGAKNIGLASDSQISATSLATKSASNPELAIGPVKQLFSDSAEYEMNKLKVKESSPKHRDSDDTTGIIDEGLSDPEPESFLIEIEASKDINEMPYEENDKSLITDFDPYCWGSGNYAILKPVYVNPFKSSKSKAKSPGTKSKEKSAEKSKPIPITYQSVDFIEKIFPKAAFAPESPPPNWTASPGFLKSLCSSPRRSSIDSDDLTGPIPDLSNEKTKYLELFKYKNKDVVKRGTLYLKLQYLSCTYLPMYLILLKNGSLLIYEENKKQNTSENPYLAYNLKNCDFQKVESSKSEKAEKDKKTKGAKKVKEILSFFEIRVFDIIRTTLLTFMAKNQVLRNEWMASLEQQKSLLEEAGTRTKMFSRVEKEIENGVTTGMGDFEIIRPMGRGTFGKIIICKQSDTGHLYAMKMMRRDVIARYDGGVALLNEYRALRSYRHPFLQKMKYTFLNAELVVFGMQYPTGGPLAAYIFELKKYSEEMAIFYGFQLAAAIMYLHSKNILVRALTINHLYLDKRGNLKLLDFGLRYFLVASIRHNFYVKNSPAYVSPEQVVYDSPYRFTSDWWAYGICMLVMVTGEEPFKGVEGNVVFNLMRTKSRPIDYNSENMSVHMKDFIEKILTKEFQNRIGCRKDQEILEHEVFAKLVYASEKDIKIDPPIKPIEVDNEAALTRGETLENVVLTPPKYDADQYLLKSNVPLPAAFESRYLRPYEGSTTSSSATNFSTM